MHKDLKNLWLPYTQMKDIEFCLKAKKTIGAKIYLENNQILVDAISSWWTACHGYNNKYIIKKAKKQLETMPHIMFGGLIHNQAIKLSNRISSLLGNNLSKVFFSDSGSVAIEVAMKIAVQYWINKGKKNKNKFVHFYNGYHGDTSGAMSICDPEEGMHNIFGKYLKKNLIAHLPDDAYSKDIFEKKIKNNVDNIAAIVIEPIVQCAGGMKIYSTKVLDTIFKISKKYNILLIYDEIATGFGRTGTMFAYQQSKSRPDIICLGKGLTAGIMTLAITATTKKIFNGFLSHKKDKEFMHGPTYMSNPLACSVANASLDIFEKDNTLLKVMKIESFFKNSLSCLKTFNFVKDIRVKGAIAVIEIKNISKKRLIWLRNEYIIRGVWARPIRNVIYFMPPFIISLNDLKKIVSVTKSIFNDWDRCNDK